MQPESLASLAGTQWAGKGELWLDGRGDEAHHHDCVMTVGGQSLRYSWSHENKAHAGTLTLGKRSARWADSWHQAQPVECAAVPGARGLLAVAYRYPASDGPDWEWRLILSQRPSGEVVLQMTNVAPWGEEIRAVRMVFTRQDGRPSA